MFPFFKDIDRVNMVQKLVVKMDIILVFSTTFFFKTRCGKNIDLLLTSLEVLCVKLLSVNVTIYMIYATFCTPVLLWYLKMDKRPENVFHVCIRKLEGE